MLNLFSWTAMPYSELLQNHVSLFSLAPHLRRVPTNRRDYNGTGTVISDSISLMLAEDVSEGDALAWHSSGKVGRAGLGKPCVAIAGENGVSGGVITAYDSGLYSSDRYGFTPGQPVWMIAGTVNVVTAYSESDTYIQRIGTAVDSKSFVIAIDNYCSVL